MQIKEILKYDWNYGEYIVTDGYNDIVCMCVSVPLPDNLSPEIGMKISILYAFFFKDVKIEKLAKQEDKVFFIERGQTYFEYCLYGKIFDVKKALVKVYGFIVSLEYDFSDGFPSDYSEGDFIKINADRLDCCIELM